MDSSISIVSRCGMEWNVERLDRNVGKMFLFYFYLLIDDVENTHSDLSNIDCTLYIQHRT